MVLRGLNHRAQGWARVPPQVSMATSQGFPGDSRMPFRQAGREPTLIVSEAVS